MALKLLTLFRKIGRHGLFSPKVKKFILSLLWTYLLLLLGNDIEKNPGPCRQNYLKLFHWNLNSIKTDNYARISLIEAFNAISNYDVIGLSETGLHQSDTDFRLNLDGYHPPIRKDITSENENYGGVLFFVRDSLPITERSDLETVKNQLIIEINVSGKKIIISLNYRCHHKSEEELIEYMENFNKSCENIKNEDPFCCLILGDLNSHQNNWWGGDVDDNAGNLLSDILYNNMLFQLVNEPTHIINESRSCIDLVISDQPNIINNCSIYPSLSKRCHHQINHVELNIGIPAIPPYTRKLWHFDRANIVSIRKSLNSVRWSNELRARENNPDLQVSFLTETILNICSNFIPNETRKIKPKRPPWYTRNIEHSLRIYKKKYKVFKNRGFPIEMNDEIAEAKSNYDKLVLDAKDNFLKSEGARLSDAKTNIKSYWKIIKKLPAYF